MFHERMVQVSSRVALFTSSTDGPAEKTLLVVHGGPDWDHSYLREPLSQLAGNHRVVLPDLRGCGRSTSGLDDGQYTPDAAVGGLIALVDELSAPQVAVLGFSNGGLIAQRLTVTAPERVSRMVIAASSVLPVDAQAFGEWPEREERLAAEASAWADPSLSGPELTRAAAIAGASANVGRAAALPGYPIDSPQSGSPPNGCGPGGGGARFLLPAWPTRYRNSAQPVSRCSCTDGKTWCSRAHSPSARRRCCLVPVPSSSIKPATWLTSIDLRRGSPPSRVGLMSNITTPIKHGPGPLPVVAR